MSTLKRSLALREDFDGVVTATLSEYDEKGTQTGSQEKVIDNRILEELDGELFDRVWFTAKSTEEYDAETQIQGRTPADIALEQQEKQSRDDVNKPRSVVALTGGDGKTRILAVEDDASAGSGPIASGDPNVNDNSMKVEDGPAAPRIRNIDLNAPAQPIAGAPRGGRVLESVTEQPKVEVDEDPADDEEDHPLFDPNASNKSDLEETDEEVEEKDALQDATSTRTGLAAGEPQTEGGTKVLPQNEGAEPGDPLDAGQSKSEE